MFTFLRTQKFVTSPKNRRSKQNCCKVLHYVWFSQFWSHFRGTMHCLPQRLKSTLFEIFSNGGCPKGTRSVEKISNNVDFSLWGNRATTWEYFLTFSSETKIMKITHSAMHAYLKFLPQTIITYWWLFTLCKKDLEGLLAIYTDRRLRKNQSESFGRSSFLLLNNLSFYDLCLVCIQFFKHTEAKIGIIY